MKKFIDKHKGFIMTLCLMGIFFLFGWSYSIKIVQDEANQFIIDEYYSMGYNKCIEWCNGYDGVTLEYHGKVMKPFSRYENVLSNVMDNYSMS